MGLINVEDRSGILSLDKGILKLLQETLANFETSLVCVY